MGEQRRSLEARVVPAAEATLAEQSYVRLIDVPWLTPQALDVWRQGWVRDLERLAQANLDQLSAAMVILERWATDRGLHPSPRKELGSSRRSVDGAGGNGPLAGLIGDSGDPIKVGVEVEDH